MSISQEQSVNKKALSSSVMFMTERTVADALDSGCRPTVGDALRYRARENPDLDFVVSMTRRMSYAEAEAASARLARRMLGEGVGKGTRVGLYFSYSHEFVVAWLAASRIGALVVPLSTLFTPRELVKVLRIGDVDLLLTNSVVAGKDVVGILESALPTLADATGPAIRVPDAPFLRRIWFADDVYKPWACTVDLFADPLDSDPGETMLSNVENEVVPADLGLVVYTSGSTADPKGVVHSQGALLRSSTYLDFLMNIPGGGYPKVLCAMPFFWIGGMLSLTRSVRYPMTLLLIDKFDPGDAMEIMERERGTGVMGWPTLIDAIRQHPDFESRDLSSAPGLVGGPSDVSTIGAPRHDVSWHRGMTETVGNFSGVQVKVIDSETGRELPDGEDGELLVRGPGTGVMTGYYKKEWSEAFDEDGWYHTGDRVYLAQGSRRPLFRDRLTEMIKSAGANVAPREVELALEELEEVSACFVFGIPHSERGEEVTAVVVAAPGVKFSQAEVKARARERLSAFKVPTRWIVTEPETITWLGSGKPDRRRLRTLIETGRLS